MEPAFTPETRAALDRAEALCHARGARLTELRRTVLGHVLGAGRPIGAYDVLDQLRTGRKGAAPPTVYRALDFLLEHGLIHKLARLSAFVGCVTPDDGAHVHHGHGHAAQFLICRECGKVAELEDHGLTQALAAAAVRQGFAVSGSTIEAEGMCADCQHPGQHHGHLPTPIG